jgi:regulator of sirC expression with transglutaminase-like and TPR domain
MDFPPARQRFYEEITQPDEQIDLATAALYLAQEEYPGLDVNFYLSALETMAVEVMARLPTERYPLRMIQALNQYLYNDFLETHRIITIRATATLTKSSIAASAFPSRFH